MKRMMFVSLTVRLVYRAMLDAAIAAGVALMLDPLFTRGRDRLKILVRNRTVFWDLVEISCNNRIHQVWTRRYAA